MRRQPQISTLRVTIDHDVTDGAELHLGHGKYRHQIEFHCSVACDVEPGDPGVMYDRNGEGYPATGPSVDIQSVTVTGCTIYARPDFCTGVDIDSREDFYAEFLEGHAEWCREQIEADHAEEFKTGIYDVHGVYTKAIEAANREWCDRRDAG